MLEATIRVSYTAPFYKVRFYLTKHCSQATMKEAMRMHPAVGFPLERFVPAEGAEVCGVMLPAGTNISISAPVVHMNTDVFGIDAAEFRPERWLEASPEQLKMMDRSFLAVSCDEDRGSIGLVANLPNSLGTVPAPASGKIYL